MSIAIWQTLMDIWGFFDRLQQICEWEICLIMSRICPSVSRKIKDLFVCYHSRGRLPSSYYDDATFPASINSTNISYHIITRPNKLIQAIKHNIVIKILSSVILFRIRSESGLTEAITYWDHKTTHTVCVCVCVNYILIILLYCLKWHRN